MKAATSAAYAVRVPFPISIHAAREGGDLAPYTAFESELNISIHAAREGGDAVGEDVPFFGFISIHAAREGGDRWGSAPATEKQNFNPRRP